MKHLLSFIFMANVISSSTALSLDKKTARHPICGVESYNAGSDPMCGVELYLQARSEACGVERYNRRVDMRCPGSRPWAPLGPGVALIGPGGMPPDLGGPKECELPEFGVALWKSCRASAHGVERYSSCKLPQFGVESYRSCSFYKTPEELDAYIDATTQTLVNNAVLLPVKQSDLYTAFRQEASFICLIDKYNQMPGYEDVVKDLTDKFFTTFGYEFNESSLTCADASKDERSYKITAGSLDCANYTINTIRNVTKPEGIVQAVFNRFKANCTTKLTYSYLVNWFEDKIDEIDQLLGDRVAREDADRKKALEDLKKSISESK